MYETLKTKNDHRFAFLLFPGMFRLGAYVGIGVGGIGVRMYGAVTFFYTILVF